MFVCYINKQSYFYGFMESFHKLLKALEIQNPFLVEEGTSNEKMPHQVALWAELWCTLWPMITYGGPSSIWMVPPPGYWSWVLQKAGWVALSNKPVGNNHPRPLPWLLSAMELDLRVVNWNKLLPQVVYSQSGWLWQSELWDPTQKQLSYKVLRWKEVLVPT